MEKSLRMEKPSLNHRLYQNWAHAWALPHMSPYFGKAHGLRLLTYIKQILFDLVKLSIDLKPYIRKAHNYRV
jgi:hypothetical protein